MLYNITPYLFFLTLITNISDGQTKVVKVVDDLISKPINGASISINDSTLAITNYKGLAQFKITEKDSAKIKITHKDYYEKYIIPPEANKFQIGLEVKNLLYTEGLPKLYQSIGINLKYPKEARSRKIQGTVYARFSIDSTGTIAELEIINDPHRVFGSDVKKVMMNLPGKWSVDYQGKIFIIPFNFIIQRKSPDKNTKTEAIQNIEIKYDRLFDEITCVAYEH